MKFKAKKVVEFNPIKVEITLQCSEEVYEFIEDHANNNAYGNICNQLKDMLE